MSANITERAAELRSTAASSLIRNELESKDISRLIAKFIINSTTAVEITENELINLVKIKQRVKAFLDEVISSLTDTSSAVSASVNPPNSAPILTTIINIIDTAKTRITEAEEKMVEFEGDSDFSKRRSTIISIHDKLSKTLIEITNALNQLHKLLFGDVTP